MARWRVQFFMGGDLTGGIWSKPYEVEATDRTGAIISALCLFPASEQEKLQKVQPRAYKVGS